jgi:hypothetical protein
MGTGVRSLDNLRLFYIIEETFNTIVRLTLGPGSWIEGHEGIGSVFRYPEVPPHAASPEQGLEDS